MIKQFFFLFLLAASVHAFSQGEDDNQISDQFIVMLNPALQVNELIKEFPSLQIKKCLSKQMNIWLLQRNSVVNPDNFLLQIRANKTVKLAQFNHLVQRRALVPDDTYFSNQWNMLNTGQAGGTIGADIDATDAWAVNHNNVTANGDSIVIAIIDGAENAGFDITHEDLNFFVNIHEIPGNGIDDDSNGFTDDYYGWNAFDSTADINPGGSTDAHAMHVSGIAAAIGNNAKGVAGVCWGAKILRVVGASGDESQVVQAYDYVREMRRLYNNTNGSKGAFVVSTNSSFGVNGARHTSYPIWCAMYDSMGAVGILSAAATADFSENVDVSDDVPTGCPSKFLISVTNTTRLDKLDSGGAAWGGTTIAIGAPGTNIYSTESSNSYGIMTGTSMSSPHIAGAVGAMFAAACPKMLADYKLFPDSIALVTRQMMLSGVTRLSTLYNKTITGGRLNLYNAVKNVAEYNCGTCGYSVSLTITQPACSNTCNGSVQVNVTGNGVYSYAWSNGHAGTNVVDSLCPGVYAVTVTDIGNGCQQIQNAYLYKPDSINVSSIHIIPVEAGDSGNIIVTANAGNYPLNYSLNGTNYQQASTLIVSSNGNYNVYISNGIGCIVEKSVIVSGVEDLTLNNDWSLFPNPATEQLNITLNISKNADLSFAVTNILGQKLIRQTRFVTAGISTITTDVSKLSSGTYFITLSGNNSISTRKFIITH